MVGSLRTVPPGNAPISESAVAGDPIELTEIHYMWNT